MLRCLFNYLHCLFDLVLAQTYNNIMGTPFIEGWNFVQVLGEGAYGE